MLAWLRLRVALGQALGTQNPRLVTARTILSAPERPAGLRHCSDACLRRAAPLLEGQHLAVPVQPGAAWLLSAASPTGVEACWNLIPGFHGRWPALWDLRALEGGWGGRAFGRAEATAALARCDSESQSGACHRRLRSARQGVPPATRLAELEAEGWLVPAVGGGLQLAPTSLDAVSLLRLVLGARVHVPTEALDRLGRIGPPKRAAPDRHAQH